MPIPESSRRRGLAIMLGCFALYAVASVIDTLKGVTLSSLLAETRYSYSLGGLIVSAFYLGYMAANLAIGAVSERFGKKAPAMLSAVFLVAGSIGLAIADRPAAYLASSFLNGMGGGASLLACNVILIDLRSRDTGRWLNLLYAVFGLCSMLTPLYARLVMAGNGSWRNAFQYAALAAGFTLAYLAWARYPAGESAPGSVPPSRLNLRELARLALSGRMFWYYLIVFAYIVTEVGLGTWLVEYFQKVRGHSHDDSQAWLSIFYAGIMGGRLLGSLVVDRVGHLRCLALGGGACLLSLLLGQFGPDWCVYALPASGLFLSVILPTAAAHMSSRLASGRDAALGAMFAFIGVGGMTGPLLIGMAGSHWSLDGGMAVTTLSCLVMLAAIRRAGKDAARG
jgi:fucose permease